MDAQNTGALYKIWGVDHVVYGPVELPMLVAWVKEERVTPDTWLFLTESEAWKKAAELPELKFFFQKKAVPAAKGAATSTGAGVKTSMLRRVKILADMSESQLEKFANMMVIQEVRQWAEIVKQGDHGDTMYLILDGELRVRLMVNGKETILTTLQSGEFFGEIALFDSGPRSADVVANRDSTLLKISAESFSGLQQNAPELAAPFLFALGKTLTARIRADNKRYRDSVAFSRSAGVAAPKPA